MQHPPIEALVADAERRQAEHRELFRHQLDPGVIDQIRKATNGNFALGDDRFAEQIADAREEGDGTQAREVEEGGSGSEC